MCPFVHINNSLLGTICSLNSNSTYSFKCEKEDTGLDVTKFQNPEQLLILVTASLENSFNVGC